MRFGMIGLGKMGSGLLKRAIAAGHECVAFDPNGELVVAAEAAGAIGAHRLDELVSNLPSPRAVWIMVPEKVTGQVIEQLSGLLERGDTIIDGGNSNYRASVDRAAELAKNGIEFVDVGTSGGVFGRERGFCLMIGGSEAIVEGLGPLFQALAPGIDAAPRTPGRNGDPRQAEQGYLYCGPAGAGHFAKMVHNGIEYAMMAGLAEGLNLLAKAGAGNDPKADLAEADAPYYRYRFDLADLTEVWRRGSVISSWLLDLTANALAEDPGLEGFSGRVSDSGEGRWTAHAAVDLGVPAHTLTAALFDRFESREQSDTANRLLSAMRKQFGGHQEEPAR